MKKITLLISILLSLTTYLPAQVYLDPSQPVEARVDDLLQRMTLDEKIGQMMQAERQAFDDITEIKTYFMGSLLSGGGSAPTPNTGTAWADMYDNYQQQAMATRLGIPLIYGVDAVHGHNNVKDAVIFPHNIGLGCTRNPELVQEAARITALEIMGTGLNWTFAPCIAVTRDERWGRTYEGFGETPDLVSMMGVAAVKGYQGDSLWGKSSILACAKHYIGDGGTTNGDDQGNTQVTEQRLRELFLPAYIEAINAGVGSVMASYSSWNGQKMHGHKYLLTDVLKTELGFDGFVISDYYGIDQLPGDYPAQVEASINAGVDMIMLPFNYKEFSQTVKALVSQNRITTTRIDDAVRRILRIKFRAGLFEQPYSDRFYTNQIGSDAHRQVARQCVRESLVLLTKKDNVLPLKKDGIKIHVAGKNANNIGNQCGGWSISWQGTSGNITKGTTILKAIQNAVNTSTVTTSINGSAVGDADIAIAVIGETPYAEGQGDRDDLGLSQEDIETVRNLKASGKPVIVILISGRPMIIESILPYSDAIVAAWLPGTEGDGIADILFGDYQPTGLLSNTWPADMASVPLNFGDNNYKPLFAYGHGLTSLSNSPAGSSPIPYSGMVNSEGDIEFSFTKALNAASINAADFKIKINYNEYVAATASLKPSDPNTVILTLTPTIKKTDKVYISYQGSTCQSVDGGMLELFDSFMIYNSLKDNKLQIFPTRIQAEDYYAMSGVQTENTSDINGGLNVGWIDANDWMEYSIQVPQSGTWLLEFRVSGNTADGQFTVSIPDTTLATIDVPFTGGWQNWRTISANVKLKPGKKMMKLSVKKGGFNLNWIDARFFETDTIVTIEIPFKLKQNYPNPFYPETKIEYWIAKKTHVKLAIYDLKGQQVAVLADQEIGTGIYNVTINAQNLGLRNGTYIYKMEAGEFSEVKKLLVK